MTYENNLKIWKSWKMAIAFIFYRSADLLIFILTWSPWHICTKILSVLEKYFEKINSHPYPLTYRDDTYFYKEYGLSDIMHFSEWRSNGVDTKQRITNTDILHLSLL